MNNKFRTDKILGKIGIYILLVLAAIIFLIPFVWMISASIKTSQDVYGYPIRWIPKDPQWSNYLTVMKEQFLLYYANTLKIAGLTTFLGLFTSSLAAYSFAKLRYPLKDSIFLIYLATIMIPIQAVLIPQFMLMKTFKLVNNHWSVILIMVSSFSPFGVFMLRQFFVTLPNSLIEAARIDGCSETRIYAQIIMPLSTAGISALLVFYLMWSWNNTLLPVIYLFSKALLPVTKGLLFFQTQFQQSYHLIMAGTVMSIAPLIILYFFAQKTFISGIALSGMKG
jgi:multiple sugar transport system permease protein